MGQVESRPSHCKEVQNKDGSFVIVTNDPIDSFKFNSSQSYLVSYGIDYQKHDTFNPIVDMDAKAVCDAMIDVGLIPLENASVYVGSKHSEDCTFAGIKRTLQDCAAKVGPEGLLVFHFSGHGIKAGKNEWGLAPLDYDETRSTYLTARVLVEWINEARCRAKHILFTLDCCFAGGIGKELIKSVDIKVDANIYVISACTEDETSPVIDELKNSTFTYFLTNAILKCTPKDGPLPVKDIFQLCHMCCENFSSLLIRYDPESDDRLKSGTMQPEMGVRYLQSAIKELMGEGADQVDAAVTGRFDFAVSLYNHDRRGSIPSLSEKSFAYLEEIASFENGPLLRLEQEGVLNQLVLDAALCSIMYSLASIELVCNPDSLPDPNYFITAFMFSVATIDKIHSGVEYKKEVFLNSLEFYREVLNKNKINTSDLQSIIGTTTLTEGEGNNSDTFSDATDFTDSPCESPTESG